MLLRCTRAASAVSWATQAGANSASPPVSVETEQAGLADCLTVLCLRQRVAAAHSVRVQAAVPGAAEHEHRAATDHLQLL